MEYPGQDLSVYLVEGLLEVDEEYVGLLSLGVGRLQSPVPFLPFLGLRDEVEQVYDVPPAASALPEAPLVWVEYFILLQVVVQLLQQRQLPEFVHG